MNTRTFDYSVSHVKQTNAEIIFSRVDEIRSSDRPCDVLFTFYRLEDIIEQKEWQVGKSDNSPL